MKYPNLETTVKPICILSKEYEAEKGIKTVTRSILSTWCISIENSPVSQGIWKESHYLATNISSAHVSYTHKEGFDDASLSNHFKFTDRTWGLTLMNLRSWYSGLSSDHYLWFMSKWHKKKSLIPNGISLIIDYLPRIQIWKWSLEDCNPWVLILVMILNLTLWFLTHEVYFFIEVEGYQEFCHFIES